MADHETPGRPDGRPPLRIGDAERQRMIDTLQQHVSAGRLDMPEYERRVEHATGAVFARDLEGLLDDLPRLDDEPRDTTGPRDEGRGGGRGDRRRDRSPGWWPPSDERGYPPWMRGPRGRGRGVPGPLLFAGAVALVVLTHGWILFPLLFLFVSAKGWGPCRPHGGHHRQGDDGHGHHGSHGRRVPRDRHGHAGRRPDDHDRWDHGTRGQWDDEGVWVEPGAEDPVWPGRYEPQRDDRSL